MLNILLEAILAYLATVGFGVILNIPRRALTVAGWIGLAGWLVYKGFIGFHQQQQPSMAQLGLAMLMAGLVIGVLSNVAARRKHMPMILFNIPSLVPLVPGGQAYQVVRNLVMNHVDVALMYLGQVVTVAGMIALGFLLAELLARIQLRFHHLSS
ncbi:threonine/serine exporter family protein [Furfurilactobacillus siliginis]|uniref:Membrane protein n=1 Tax=Furfurilactobacillus siliginis TaxID=348151 RepID=A0A0R2KXN5_9LACO|nr:threonine/serine exporter family protein [Furfurilactobacillus siliginis]KRN94226.1 integral membrane protein [Furfurilactobacillus siliginis]GEK29254.1 membrane protein [Furfurilactobacillus siliginis]